MPNSFLTGGFLDVPQTRHRVFVSYHHDGDQAYYNSFSETFHDNYEAISDNSLVRAVDSDDPEYIMRRIRENHITGTSCTLVFVGAQTPGRKYVDWEIDATLQKRHGLIGVQLPTAPLVNNQITLPYRLNDNVNSGYALWVHWNQITASVQALEGFIRDANSRSKDLIRNNRDRLLRNAS
jgi:hypothetical protein